MFEGIRRRPEVGLLISLLALMLAAPLLERGAVGKMILAALMFVPLFFALLRLSQIRNRWFWPSVSLAATSFLAGVIDFMWVHPALAAVKWFSMAGFYLIGVILLFLHLRSVRTVSPSDLINAINIYLMLGMAWFAMYCASNGLVPSAFNLTGGVYGSESELLYFSFVTLATIGYGDIVPKTPEVRMLAALEGVIAVLYIAITVAILVGGFKRNQS